MRYFYLILSLLLLGGCSPTINPKPSPSSALHSEHSEGEEHKEESASDHAGHDEGSEHGDEHSSHEGEGFVELTPAQKQEIGLEIVSITKMSGESTGARPGRIEVDPDRKVIISSQISGTVSQFYVQVGSDVNQGALVATVSSPELTSLKADFHEAEVKSELARKELGNSAQLILLGDEAQRQVEEARSELATAQAERKGTSERLKSASLKTDRLEKLLKDGIASQQQVEEARADRGALRADLEKAETAVAIAQQHLARERKVASSKLRIKAEKFPAEASLALAEENMEHLGERIRQLGADPRQHEGSLRLTSPVSGTVIERPVTRGEQVDPGTPVAIVVDSSVVWVWIELQKPDLKLVSKGSPVALTLVEDPSEKISGKIDFIVPQVDAETQTTKARVVLRDPPKSFRLGTFVNAVIATKDGGPIASVPRSAVQVVEGESIVYIVEKDGFRRHPVSLGAIKEDRVAVRGLSPESQVVTKGSQALKSLDLSGSIGGHSH